MHHKQCKAETFKCSFSTESSVHWSKCWITCKIEMMIKAVFEFVMKHCFQSPACTQCKWVVHSWMEELSHSFQSKTAHKTFWNSCTASLLQPFFAHSLLFFHCFAFHHTSDGVVMFKQLFFHFPDELVMYTPDAKIEVSADLLVANEPTSFCFLAFNFLGRQQYFVT